MLYKIGLQVLRWLMSWSLLVEAVIGILTLGFWSPAFGLSLAGLVLRYRCAYQPRRE